MLSGDLPEVHESCDGGPLFGDDATAAVQTRYLDASSFLRELLEANGYTAHTAIERTGVISAAGGPPGGDEFFDMRHRGDLGAELSRDAQGNLLLLFLVGRALDEATCEATFGCATFAQLLDFGLLLRTHVKARVLVHSAVQIYPLALRSRELMLATDWDLDGTDRTRDRRYAVMPIGLDSLQLALSLPMSLTGMRVLDVCSGSGIQALTAAAHGAADVLATDISARAIRFVRFNTALNALDDVVRVAEGSCYQPARGEVFDVILANPPFVAVPPTEAEAIRPALYVSGGADGADVVRELVCGAVAAQEGAVSGMLAPGGCLLLVAQLPEIDAAHVWLLGAARAKEAQRSAIEIAIVYDPRHTQSAEQYAAARAADYGCSARDWAASMRAAGARTMGFGVVSVRVRRACFARRDPNTFPTRREGGGGRPGPSPRHGPRARHGHGPSCPSSNRRWQWLHVVSRRFAGRATPGCTITCYMRKRSVERLPCLGRVFCRVNDCRFRKRNKRRGVASRVRWASAQRCGGRGDTREETISRQSKRSADSREGREGPRDVGLRSYCDRAKILH